ncbi:BTB/POZ and MATH domain-containing protein 1-like [Triticum dicoccoides]|uniref:BTB/POZ and MATH domain-containing protein 1-like n=1 Tax=Triticum dicoccoides TaxID=85692 RepID=UPI001891A95C|nr:BTB/POZ and MATH domain-containing protein 1-like [Triticum dicoccoides]
MPASAAEATITSKTSSTVVVHTGEHLFKVVGHSLVTGSNTILTSETFRAGGHDWAIAYYPNGRVPRVDEQFTSVFLKLISPGDGEVRASYSFCLQDPESPSTNRFIFGKTSCKFLFGGKGLGTSSFVSKADLAASGCLKDDCLVIKCTVEVYKVISEDKDNGNITVPPSNLSIDLSDILESGLKADLTVKIGSSKSFKVHACVLSARSPVFGVLLHYMYKDSLPAFMEETTEEATNMAQHLLVAADRYAVERLKLMCESKLSKALDVKTAGFTLDLAERYNCQQLKGCCLKYMARDFERLRDIKRSEGFEQLKKNHPLVVCDIFDEVIEKLNRQVVITFPS